jgi:uncharacterized protein (TIGR00251 family)
MSNQFNSTTSNENSEESWLSLEKEGSYLLHVHAKPRSSRNRIVGVSPCGKWLDIAIAAPPVEGEANTALLAFLGKQLKIRQSHISLIRGDSARFKTFRIQGLKIEEIRSKLNLDQ